MARKSSQGAKSSAGNDKAGTVIEIRHDADISEAGSCKEGCGFRAEGFIDLHHADSRIRKQNRRM